MSGVSSSEEPLAISVEEAGRLLGVSRPTAFKMAQRDDFPAFRVGGRVLVYRQGLEDWIRQQAGGTGP